MRHMRRRLWHAVHTASFAVFVMGTVHAFTAGTDGGNAAVQWMGLASVTAFVFLVVFRQLSSGAARPASAAGRRRAVAAVPPPGVG
jgi:hypothetical protein